MSQSAEMDLPYWEAPSVEDPSVEDLLKNVSSAMSARENDAFAIGGHVQEDDGTSSRTKLAIRWDDEGALEEDTVCMTESRKPAWTEGWYRGDEDTYCPDPVNDIDREFSREKVKWLNCAPKNRRRELSVAVASVAEGELLPSFLHGWASSMSKKLRSE